MKIFRALAAIFAVSTIPCFSLHAWGASPPSLRNGLPARLGLISPFPAAAAPPSSVHLSNGLNTDSSGNLFINAGLGGGGTPLSNGLNLDSNGNLLVNCTVGCLSLPVGGNSGEFINGAGQATNMLLNAYYNTNMGYELNGVPISSSILSDSANLANVTQAALIQAAWALTSAGTFDGSQSTVANGFKVQSLAGCTSNGTSSICYNPTTGLMQLPTGGASSTPVTQTSTVSAAGYVPCSGTTAGIYNPCTLSAENPQTATYQVLASDFSSYKTINVASGTFTITLVASTSQPPAGQYIKVLNYGSGQVTIARSGQNLNGGTTSLTLLAAGATIPTAAYIESDGTNYFAYTVGDNAGTLLSHTWAAPAAIGSNTPAAGTFTLITSTTNTQKLSADTSTITATTPATGTVVFTWGALPVSTNLSFNCYGSYTQATAAGGVSIAVQGATNAPTRIDAWATMDSTNPASTTYTGTKSGTYNLATTTATNVATVTPGATGTQYQWELHGTIQVGTSASTLNVIFYSGSSSDAVVVKAGSFCSIAP